jgi:uncharacterized protein (DUF362 family)
MNLSGMVQDVVSVIQRPGVTYPEDEAGYPPSEAYPEYRGSEPLAQRTNPVYGMVRDCLAQAGLDAERFGSPEWNPLGDFVPAGSRVFVLCNFVHHRLDLESEADFLSKCTHGSVVRALVDYLLIATGPSGFVRFGNAPVQSCNWNRVLEDTGAARVVEYYRRIGAPVEACDLRMFVAERDLMGRVKNVETRGDDGQIVAIDLGADSLLDCLYEGSQPKFRVGEYDPDRTEAHHGQGRHVYLLHQHVLGADVVVSIPKLKTHKKVGITCGIKGSVGAIAHKDCLAHHRLGSPDAGGDEYPSDRAGVLRQLSRFHDFVWRTSPTTARGNMLRVVDRTLRRFQGVSRRVTSGSWWGNDTAWRMSLDIARIIAHAGPDGVMKQAQVRPHLMFLDGVVGGERNGPLRPSPNPAGVVLFSADIALGDHVAACIMGFDPGTLPLVSNAFAVPTFPVTPHRHAGGRLVFNGSAFDLKRMPAFLNRPFEAPPGWTGRMTGPAPVATAPSRARRRESV